MVGELTWQKRLLGLWLPLAGFLVVGLFPFTWMAATSLKTNAELYEAAEVDGAGRAAIFRLITLPMLRRILMIAALFRTLDALRAFDLMYVLTGGGPANSTHLMATYAYSLSMGAGQMGLGSAVALSMVPVLGLLLVLLTLYVRKD